MNDFEFYGCLLWAIFTAIFFMGWLAMWADRNELQRRLDRTYDESNKTREQLQLEIKSLHSNRDRLVYRIQEELRRPQGA